MTEDQILNLLTIVVLVPLFVVAAVGGFFLAGARQTWMGGLASFLSMSTAVAIPLFAFKWRTGTPFVEAVTIAVVGGPGLTAAFIISLILRSALRDPVDAYRDLRDLFPRKTPRPPDTPTS